MTRQKTVRESSVEMAQVMFPSMVSLDENRRPMAVPKIVPQTEGEKRRFEEGRLSETR